MKVQVEKGSLDQGDVGGEKIKTLPTENTEVDKDTREFKNVTRTEERVLSKKCEEGYFAYNGRCIKCPEGSTWNGKSCVTSEIKENQEKKE